MKKIILILSLTCVIVLMSCSQSSIPQTRSTSTIIVSNTISKASSQTWTPEPTNTFTPSTTPNILTLTSQSVNETFSADFATIKAQKFATRESAYTTLEAKNVICTDGYYSMPYPEDIVKEYSQITSPNTQWITIQCLGKDKSQRGYTLIVNRENSKTWHISYNALELPYNAEFLSRLWTDTDGKFLYLAPSNLSSPSGGNPLGYLFGSGKGLYRLDLESGELIEVLREIADGRYIDISMTEDAHYIAWSTSTEKNVLFLQNLTSSEITTIKVDESYKIVGALTWSPDNKTLVFASSMYELEDTLGISLFVLNAETMELQSLLYNDARNFVPWFNSNTNQIWYSNDVVNLASYSQQDRWFTNTEWSLNIRTGEVIPLPKPTSTP